MPRISATMLVVATLLASGCGGSSGAPKDASASGAASDRPAATASRLLTLDGRAIDAPAITVTRTGFATYRAVVDEPELSLDLTIDLTEHLFAGSAEPDPANAVGKALEGSEHGDSLSLVRALVDGRPVVFTPACYPPDTHVFGSLTRLDSRMDARFTLFALFGESRADHCGARTIELTLSAPIDPVRP